MGAGRPLKWASTASRIGLFSQKRTLNAGLTMRLAGWLFFDGSATTIHPSPWSSVASTSTSPGSWGGVEATERKGLPWQLRSRGRGFFWAHARRKRRGGKRLRNRRPTPAGADRQGRSEWPPRFRPGARSTTEPSKQWPGRMDDFPRFDPRPHSRRGHLCPWMWGVNASSRVGLCRIKQRARGGSDSEKCGGILARHQINLGVREPFGSQPEDERLHPVRRQRIQILAQIRS